MSPGRDRLRDLLPVQGVSSVVQRDRTRPAPLPCAGQIAPKMEADCVLWSLGACGTRAPPSPAAGDLSLLPDTSLIRQPDLDRLAASLGLRDLVQTGGEVFSKAETAASFFA